jgi:hypothetical protein
MAWITAALTAASAGANYAGQKRSDKAMDAARLLERKRQGDMQKDSAALFDASVADAGAATAEEDIAAASNKRLGDITEAMAEPVGRPSAANQLGVSAGNKVIGGEVARGQASADAYGKTYARGMSGVGGFTDRTLQNNIANNRALNSQANIGNFMRGSLGVLPIELEAGNRKGDNLRQLGDILGTAASVTGLMSATGVNPFASTANEAVNAANAATNLTDDIVMNSAGEVALRPDFSFLSGAKPASDIGLNSAGRFALNPGFTFSPYTQPALTAARPAGWPTIPKFNLR